jgi:hypothetical protein
MLRQDKVAHLLYGYMVAVLAFGAAWWYGQRSVGQLVLTAVLAALCVGMLKEVWDGLQSARDRAAGRPARHSAEFADTLATLAGGGLFVAPILWLRVLFEWRG